MLVSLDAFRDLDYINLAILREQRVLLILLARACDSRRLFPKKLSVSASILLDKHKVTD